MSLLLTHWWVTARDVAGVLIPGGWNPSSTLLLICSMPWLSVISRVDNVIMPPSL